MQDKDGSRLRFFHPKVPQDLNRETRGYVVEFLEKVEQCKMTAYDDSLAGGCVGAGGGEMAKKSYWVGCH